jgi:transglutaminase/protease-like cytokinesis protein 3
VPVYGKSKDEAHMWNQVNLGSGWCNIDVTWDDTEELLHNYFNVTDKDILTDHVIWELYDTETRAPISEKEEYNNYIIYVVSDNASNAVEKIKGCTK